MSLNSSNTAKIDHKIRGDIMEDSGLRVPSFSGAIHGKSKDGNGTLSVDLVDSTGAYIKVANLDAQIHVMTKSISMTETYFTTVRSSADIPKFLLWLQDKVRFIFHPDRWSLMDFQYFNNLRTPLTTPTIYSIII